MPLVRVKEKFQVTIPNSLRKTIPLAVGDVLEAEIRGKAIVLKPKAVVDRATVEAAIKEGLDDLSAGRLYGPYKTLREFKRALHRR
jgi:AbrB family looped-hinge helix DNA binding protein